MDTASVIITGVHFELTEAIKSVVHEKMNKLFRHEPDIIRVRVELRRFRTICTTPSTIWRINCCENCETTRV